MKRKNAIPSPPTEKIQVVGYCRISAGKANDLSIPAQKNKIKQWATLHDAEILNIFDDNGISGTKANRPGFEQAMELATDNKATIVVYSLTRFGRSTIDILNNVKTLRDKGGNFVSITESFDTKTATGRMIFRVLAVLAEFEAEVASERTKLALDRLKSKGQKTGGAVPYGFDADETRKLTPNPAEQKVISYIKKMHNQGKSMSWIAKRLNERGILTKTGKKWFTQTVKYVLS